MDASPDLSGACIVLARPSHPGNIGAAARAMKTMGFGDLRLVAPREFPSATAEAMASGAADVLAAARVFATLDEALADAVLAVGFSARPRDLSHPVRPLREAAPQIAARAASSRVALVFGNETFGLTNEELARCQWLVTIPSNPAYGSLNLGAAVQVACYELATTRGAFEPPAEPGREPATLEEVEALHAHFERSMVASGFLDPAQPKRLMERMRRLFARAGLERGEVRFLRGMLSSFERPKRRD